MLESSLEEINFLFNEKQGITLLYLYTPMCGTCQVASKMLHVLVEIMPDAAWRKINLNYFPKFANKWSVESVPCLLILNNGEIIEKIYAFQSVPFLYEKLNQLIKSGV